MLIINMEHDVNNKLPAYAWPGGYPIVYYTGNNDSLCPDCATEDLDYIIGGDERGYSSWSSQDEHVHFAEINYEEIEHCTDCGAELVGAYVEQE